VVSPGRAEIAQRAAKEGGSQPVATLNTHNLPSAVAPRSSAEGNGDRAAIVFTSGSTGQPKGCVLSNEYFLTFGRWYRDLGGRCALRIGCERIITPLPPNHVNALAFSSMGAIMTGGCIVQLDRFRSDQWWQAVRESRASVMHYLGVMPSMLLKLPPDPKERQHELRFGIGGGIRGAAHQEFEDRFAVPLIEAWAMTETGGAGTISTHVGPRHLGLGCIGEPSPKYSEARILDASGELASPGETGELVVRATGQNPRKGFFSGYYRDPQTTELAWSGGWLHTGDLAMRDEGGSIFFAGRRKQLVRRSGENISVIEVESILGAIDHVRQVAVVPVPDAIREEEVFACIVTDGELVASQEAAEALIRLAAERLSYFKLPAYIAFLLQLPMTTTQKPRYGAIIELAQSLIAAGDPRLFDLRDVKRKYRAPH
jgi:acyl-CoA synthetase (AMP-forming)/AMP-acid ligase II